MERQVILGGFVGALVTLIFTFSVLLGLNAFSGEVMVSISNSVLGAITILLAPFAGGFLAGLEGRKDPKKAGLISGLSASVVVFVGWLFIAGITAPTILSGIALVFVWVVLARIASTLVRPR